MIKTTSLTIAFLLLLGSLFTGCSNHHVSEESASIEEVEKPDPVTYLATVMRDVIHHEDDPNVQIERMPENVLVDALGNPAPPSLKIILKNLPGNPPYCVHCRRLMKNDPDAFSPLPVPAGQINRGSPLMFCIPLDQCYLGERLTFRISETNGTIVKETMFCPKPMILKDNSGKVILEAALLSFKPSDFAYFIRIPALNEPVDFISTSGIEVLKHRLPLNEPVSIPYIPGTIGSDGGIAEVELRFVNDGSSYKMQLPWGTAVFTNHTSNK